VQPVTEINSLHRVSVGVWTYGSRVSRFRDNPVQCDLKAMVVLLTIRSRAEIFVIPSPVKLLGEAHENLLRKLDIGSMSGNSTLTARVSRSQMERGSYGASAFVDQVSGN
jgi:hypothetical protein